jgi:hypothetical protein
MTPTKRRRAFRVIQGGKQEFPIELFNPFLWWMWWLK